jgi:hypothetical protein
MGCNILVSGMIVAGDAERLTEIIEAQDIERQDHEFTYSPIGRRICFNSPGGNMLEGMQMASVILENARGTAVAAGNVCESACALSFMAGRFFGEGESYIIDRTIHPTAQLGFHAPDLAVPAGSYSEAQVGQAFIIALETLAQITERKSEQGYKFPESLFLTLLRTPSDQMYFIETVEQSSRFNIAVAPTAFYEGSTKRVILNICDAVDSGMLDISMFSNDWMSVSQVERTVEIERPTSDNVIGRTQGGYRGEAASSCRVGISRTLGTDSRPHSAARIGYAIIEGDWSTVSAFHSFPPETSLRDLPTDFQPSLERFFLAAALSTQPLRPASCWVTSDSVNIVNVDEYVNMRQQPNFSARVIREIPRNEQIRVLQPDSPRTNGAQALTQRCINACVSVRDNTGGRVAQDQVSQCVDENVIWYEVTDSRRNRGWISRKFLQEVQ